MQPLPQLKAAGVNSLIGVLRGMSAPDAFEAFVSGLPDECAALVREPPLVVSWVSLEHSVPLYAHAFEHLFRGSVLKMIELGRLQLRADMSGMYRAFLRIASPSFVLARTSNIYELYTRGCGSLRTIDSQPGCVTVLMEDRPLPSDAFYQYMCGTFEGAIELTGAKDVSVSIIAGGGTSSACRFRVTWR